MPVTPYRVMAGRIYEAVNHGAEFDEVVDGVPLDARQVESWRSLADMVLE